MLSPEMHRQVRLIDIRARRAVDGGFAGKYLSIFKGQGIEFSEVREYEMGDDIRAIDWNVTARTGRPFVKRQVEERELTVMLMVDVSRSMLFASHGRSKRDVAAEIVAVLAHSALRAHDRVGMILFTDRIERLVPPRGGRHHVARLIAELMAIEPQGTGTNVALPLERLDHAIPRRTVSFLLSDLHGPGFRRAAQRAGRRHEIVPVVVRDPAEAALPRVGMIWLQDLETGASVLVDTDDRRAVEAFRSRQHEALSETRRMFRGLGIEPVEVRTDRSYVGPLMAYFARRMQQRRAHP